MTTSRSEDVLVGLIALALVPLIAWRIWRGLRSGRLPLYRRYLSRDDSGPKFSVLLALHGLTLVAAGVIAADLLLGLDLLGRRS
jgi:hypothetical protein